MDTKEIESLDYEPKVTKPVNNSPNETVMLIGKIQGLTSLITGKLYALEGTTDKQIATLSQAREEIDLFEKTTLFELQKAFE